MASVYVVRSLVGEKLAFPGRPLLREWCAFELPAARMVGDLRVRVAELKSQRKVDVHLVVGGAPVAERDEVAALTEPLQAPPKTELPAPTGASGVELK